MIKTFCFHCGEILEQEDRFGKLNIHKKCQTERKRIEYRLSSERWRILMEDPEIKKRIREVDDKIIKEIKQEIKNE